MTSETEEKQGEQSLSRHLRVLFLIIILVVLVAALFNVAWIRSMFEGGTTPGVESIPVQMAEEPRAELQPIAGPNHSDNIITKEELAKHDRASSSPWLAILGEVFDVSARKDIYSGEGGYSFFAGVDGSSAFVTGQFDKTGLKDDISGLDASGVAALQGWLHDTYYKLYPHLGHLAGGYFYDLAGVKTPEYSAVYETRVTEGKRREKEIELERVKFPHCSSRWTQEEGGRVWCSDSGKLPRLFSSISGAAIRCACVLPEDLWDSRMKVYEGCDAAATMCPMP